MLRTLAFAVAVGIASAQDCAMDVKTSTTLNNLCCNGGGGGHRRVQAGDCVLTTCSSECANMFVPMFDSCRAVLPLGSIRNVDSFAASCRLVQTADGGSAQAGAIGASCESDDACNNGFCRATTGDWNNPESICVAFSGADAGCGGMRPPQYQTQCGPGFECANTMGPYMMDGGGQCKADCAAGSVGRDSWGNCVDQGCDSWDDGCNTCQITGGGSYAWSCTENMCYDKSSMRAPSCLDGAASGGRGGRGGRGGGGGSCGNTGASSPSCSRMMCSNLGATSEAECTAGRCCEWSGGGPPTPPSPPAPALAGERCASGFCEDPGNCPQCARGLQCANVADMCAGTCFGTCSSIGPMPPTMPPSPPGDGVGDGCENQDINVDWAGGVHETGPAAFGAQTAEPALHENLELVASNPPDGCGKKIRNRRALNGKIALIERGTCTFAEKVMNAQKAGAAAVIIFNNQPGRVRMAGDDDEITILAVIVSQEDGAGLVAAGDGTVVSLRCSGDVDQGTGGTISEASGCVSGMSCEDLRAKYDAWPAPRGVPAVCGESDAGFGGGTQCFGGSSDEENDGFEHAESICYEVGARLCSVSELNQGVGSGTGCQHNSAMIWSSTPCALPVTGEPGHMAAAGTPGVTHTCSDDGTSNAVRCCADVASVQSLGETCDVYASEEEKCTSAVGCAALTASVGGFPTARGDVAICGESDDGMEGGCHAAELFQTAQGICMAAGARLCTVEEVEADETRGTGCQFDTVPVWTADDVGCTEGQHVTVIGGSQYGNGESATCTGDQETAAVRCCADVTVGTPCTEAADFGGRGGRGGSGIQIEQPGHGVRGRRLTVDTVDI